MPGVSAKHKCPGGGQKVPPVFFCPMSGLTKKKLKLAFKIKVI